MVFSKINTSARTRPTGRRSISRASRRWPASPRPSSTQLNQLLMHGAMSARCDADILTAVNAVSPDEPAAARAAGDVPGRRRRRSSRWRGEHEPVATRFPHPHRLRRSRRRRRSRRASRSSASISAMAETLAPTDYRALVCIFLSGGNDGEQHDHPADYGRVPRLLRRPQRVAASRSTRDRLLKVTPASIGTAFGFHPSLTGAAGPLRSTASSRSSRTSARWSSR